MSTTTAAHTEGYVIMRGEYDDRAVVAVVIGDEETAVRQARELTADAVYAAVTEGNTGATATDLRHYVDGSITVYATERHDTGWV